MIPHVEWDALLAHEEGWLEMTYRSRAFLYRGSNIGSSPSPESGHRTGYDDAKKHKGSKLHVAVDTLGHVLTLHVTPADEQDCSQVERLAADVQEVAGQHVHVAFADQGDTGENAAQAAHDQGMRLEVVKLPQAKRGFVFLPR